MSSGEKKAVFLEVYGNLARATVTLERSLQRCHVFEHLDEERLAVLPDEDSDLLDALAMRCARCQDLIGPCLRALANLEEESFGDFTKLLSRMRQRGVVVSISDWNAERLLRNHIGHEYLQADRDVILFVETVRARGAAVCRYAARIHDYAVTHLGVDPAEIGQRPAG